MSSQEKKKQFITFEMPPEPYEQIGKSLWSIGKTFSSPESISKEAQNIVGGFDTVKSLFKKHADDLKKNLNSRAVSIFPNKEIAKTFDFYKDLYVEGYLATVDENKASFSKAEEVLMNFLEDRNTTEVAERMAFVCGEPGAGKSTLARKLTYEIAKKYEENFVKNKFNDLFNGVPDKVIGYLGKWYNAHFAEEVINDENIEQARPHLCHYIPLGSEKFDCDEIILSIPPFTKYIYLDGLDEVAQQNDANNDQKPNERFDKVNVVHRILSSLVTFLKKHSEMKIIIGLRTSLYKNLQRFSCDNPYETIADIFNNSSSPCFYVMPLFNQSNFIKYALLSRSSNDKLKIETDDIDLRPDYINKFLSVLNKQAKYDEALEIIKDNKYNETSSEPILFLFLLGALYNTEDSSVDNIETKAHLYHHIFKDYFNRERNKPRNQGKINPLIAMCGGSYLEFNRILEVVALCIYIGGGVTTSRKAVADYLNLYFPNKEYAKYFSENKQAPSAEAHAGIVMFYFGLKQNGEIEFIHKSFYEYYVSRAIFTLVEKVIEKDNQFIDLFFRIMKLRDKLYFSEIRFFLEQVIKLNDFIFLQNPNDGFKKYIEFLNEVLDGNIVIPFENKANNIFPFFEAQYYNYKEIFSLILGIAGICSFSETAEFWKIHMIDKYLFLLERPINLQKIDLEKSHLYNINLHNTILRRANLSKTFFSMLSLYKANLQDANLQRVHWEKANLEEVDLRGANLQGANLERANLEEADLRGANLERVNLERANLERANLEGANLKRAHLQGADLRGANLEKANLEGANLEGVDLRISGLEGADFTNAYYTTVDEIYLATKFQDGFEPKKLGMINTSELEIDDDGDTPI